MRILASRIALGWPGGIVLQSLFHVLPLALFSALPLMPAHAAGPASTPAQQLFQDWSVECPDDGRACTASTTSFAEDRTWLSTLRIQPAGVAGELPVQILVPPGVHLASGLFVGVPGARRLQATYLRCSPRACDARVGLNGVALTAWKRARAARLRYRPSQSAPPIEFEVSLMGLTAALGAAREAAP